jgi:hypothetical protein
MKKQTLLICADAGCNTGFAVVTHNLIKQLRHTWNIHVLAVNYRGDPHEMQKFAQLWVPTAAHTADYYGFGRLQALYNTIKPDAILVINDPWILKQYAQFMAPLDAKKIAYVPIDAANINRDDMAAINAVFDCVVAYTQYGIDQMVLSGLKTPTAVIPHGVNQQDFKPLNQRKSREYLGFDPNWYIVQMVDRNQPRKQIALGMDYFMRWVTRYNLPKQVKFYYHGATRDEGWDIEQLASFLNMSDRLILTDRNLHPTHGVTVDVLNHIYNIADVRISFATGEG